MKRILSYILAATLMFSCISAGAVDVPGGEDVTEILNAMKIMTYYPNGSFDGSAYVTRAALAKILIQTSSYKGLVASSSKISPFRDVPYSHWGAPYITVASQKGYMTGYSNGTFRPNNYIKYEEAISAVLKLLGYTNDDYTGGYPYGQLAVAQEINLTDGLNVTVGSAMTRQNMAQLLYNALNTSPKSNTEKVYAETLGYSLKSESLTLEDIISENITGPIVVESSRTVTSLGLNSPKVYRNGAKSTESAITVYDVLYYSRESNTVWVYTEKVTGLLESILPNKETPTSVQIDGQTYSLPHYKAQKAFGLDGLETGKIVTALLDKNGNICDAYQTDSVNETEMGVVTKAGTKTIKNTDGTSKTGYYVTVLLLSGNTIDIDRDLDSTGLIGKAVEIDFTTNTIKTYVSTTASGSSGGFISASGLSWGSKTAISKDIRILEVDDNGGVTSVLLDRLDGVNLKTGNVLLSSKNVSGAIDGMIIKNVTCDTLKYGFVTSINKQANSSSYIYEYDIAGTTGSATLDEWLSSLTEGPAVFNFISGTLDTIKNLLRTKDVSKVNRTYLETVDGAKFRISNNVLVYRIIGDSKIKSDINAAMTGDYTVWAFYDRLPADGGQIRIIYLK